MILNKFSPVFFSYRLKSLILQLLAISLFSCNKSADVNANKAFIGLTHVAYGVGPLTTTLDGTPLYSGTISFGHSTGDSLNAYDTATSRISNMVIQENVITLLSGNSAFQQQGRYSIFVYDSLDKKSIHLIILQDYPIGHPDTITNIRYMNFSPGSTIGIYLTNARDTITQYSPKNFVGYNPNPSLYVFTAVHIGNYGVIAYEDSINSMHSWKLDSLLIEAGINYNVYVQGFTDSVSDTNKLKLKSVPLN